MVKVKLVSRGVLKTPPRPAAQFFFEGYSLNFFSYCCSFMVVWGFGFGVLDFVFGVRGFQLMGFRACGVGRMGFLGWGSLYKHKIITQVHNIQEQRRTPSPAAALTTSCVSVKREPESPLKDQTDRQTASQHRSSP